MKAALWALALASIASIPANAERTTLVCHLPADADSTETNNAEVWNLDLSAGTAATRGSIWLGVYSKTPLTVTISATSDEEVQWLGWRSDITYKLDRLTGDLKMTYNTFTSTAQGAAHRETLPLRCKKLRPVL